MKKKALLAASVLMALSSTALASCGNKEDNGDAVKYTVLISKDEDSMFYSSYDNNPVVKYLQNISKDKFGAQIDLDFSALTSGSETEQFNTMLSTGDYYDMITLVYTTESVDQLYSDEVIMDLTEYVDKYMPNFKNLLETNEDFRTKATLMVNGERKVVTLPVINDGNRPCFEGLMYRRDWVVKYGTPCPAQQAEDHITSFTAVEGDDVNNTYTDNVKFPSWYDSTLKNFYQSVDSTWDGTYPVYISDWEWMMTAFKKAIDDPNSGVDTSKAYCFSIPYSAGSSAGDFVSGFGGGSSEWYRDGNEGKFGGTGSTYKAYLECMAQWYSNGWIDKSFDQRASDMFYAINTSGVHSGQVGAWVGRKSEYGTQMRDPENYPATAGCFTCGAPQPINDIYGTDENKMHVPDSFYYYAQVSTGSAITTAAKDKDIVPLLKMIDFLYTNDGSQVREGVDYEYPDPKESRILSDEFYTKWDLPNGNYIKTVNEDGSYTLTETPEAARSSNIANAGCLNRLDIGLQEVKNIVYQRAKVEVQAYTLWSKYQATAYVLYHTAYMTAEESSVYAKVKNNVETYMYTTCPDFVKGKKNFTTDWDNYCTTLNKYGPSKVSKIYTDILGRI